MELFVCYLQSNSQPLLLCLNKTERMGGGVFNIHGKVETTALKVNQNKYGEKKIQGKRTLNLELCTIKFRDNNLHLLSAAT